MLGHKVIYVIYINCSYNNVAEGIGLLDKKHFCLYRKIFMQERAFERYIPLKYLCLPQFNVYDTVIVFAFEIPCLPQVNPYSATYTLQQRTISNFAAFSKITNKA